MISSQKFIERKFQDYYRGNDVRIYAPTSIERREFGFLLFEKGMLRHMNFKTKKDLESFLKETKCSDAYHSCAYYESPKAEMDRKGWLGADLIFDIDADHIPTSCDRVHDEWICGNCSFSGKGITPNKCPVCGSEKFSVSTWPCEVCLDSAKKETTKLLELLIQDFGFSEKEVSVFFSGHRGYHVHVESEVIKMLDAVARKEIVDYVSGLGLDVSFHGLDDRNMRMMHGYEGERLGDSGWRKRIGLGMQNFVLNADEQDLRNIGLRKNIVEVILGNKESILKNPLENRTWRGIKGVGSKTWRKIADHVVELQSAKIDTVVTTDIHRLIRLTGTLHGKTGFQKVEFPVSAIDDFDPFDSAITFEDDMATVFVSDAPEFRLGDEIFGPYKSQKVELPSAAAVLLICKGRAEVLE
jgi:DNA primase small subunit